jgi:hypothetical protein
MSEHKHDPQVCPECHHFVPMVDIGYGFLIGNHDCPVVRQRHILESLRREARY